VHQVGVLPAEPRIDVGSFRQPARKRHSARRQRVRASRCFFAATPPVATGRWSSRRESHVIELLRAPSAGVNLLRQATQVLIWDSSCCSRASSWMNAPDWFERIARHAKGESYADKDVSRHDHREQQKMQIELRNAIHGVLFPPVALLGFFCALASLGLRRRGLFRFSVFARLEQQRPIVARISKFT